VSTTPNEQQYERIPVYPSPDLPQLPPDPMAEFKALTGNTGFKPNLMTWVSLFVLLAFYPGISMLGDAESTMEILENITPGMLVFMLVATILMQWTIYLINWGALFTENTGLKGIGLSRIRPIHFAYGLTFLLVSYALLSGLAWGMAQIGYPMSGELGLMIPQDTTGRIVWVFVSFTAGFCEEVAFRGYIMTRLRLIFKTKSWVLPIIVSAIAFGACHAYQGIPNMIVLSVYGAMFSLLYIRTGSLWPCVIAHFFQDLLALFIPQ